MSAATPAESDYCRIFRGECNFVAGATTVEALPAPTYPEIAFAGRSNVGKSSLINALLSRKHLVRTSSNPGHTRQVNFFQLRELMMLVDLPGYGYAKAPKHAIQAWTGLIHDYLRGRVKLRRVCLLIDARRGLTTADEGIMQLLDSSAVPYQIIFTKIDKCAKSALEQLELNVQERIRKHPAALPHILATSSEKELGLDALRAELLQLCEQ